MGMFYYRTPTKFAKVMFLHLSVGHSVHGRSLHPGGWSASLGGLHPGGLGRPPPIRHYGIRSTRIGTHPNGMHSRK